MSIAPIPSLPIGVFDSGVGGLSILRIIQTILPKESLIYIADNAFLPYGIRSQQEIQNRLSKIIEKLQKRGIKALVIACNTATAAAIDYLRIQFPEFIFVGVEPAIKPAAQLTQSGAIGVLATEYTVASPRFQRLIDQHAFGIKVYAQGCPGWVEFIESGNTNPQAAEKCVRPQIESLMQQNVDVLVLGCTHYPFLEPAIRAVASNTITIVETGTPVARQLERLLQQYQLLKREGQSTHQFFTTASANATTYSQLLGCKVQLQKFDL